MVDNVVDMVASALPHEALITQVASGATCTWRDCPLARACDVLGERVSSISHAAQVLGWSFDSAAHFIQAWDELFEWDGCDRVGYALFFARPYPKGALPERLRQSKCDFDNGDPNACEDN